MTKQKSYILTEAVRNGATADDVRKLVAGLTQEEVDGVTDDGQTALHIALQRKPDVFQAVLDAMSNEGIATSSGKSSSVLHHALASGYRWAVLAIARRQNQTDGCNFFTPFAETWNSFDAFLHGALIDDREIADVVFASVPDYMFAPRDTFCPLGHLIRTTGDSHYAIDVCLRRGPPMESMLEENRLQFVCMAARRKDLAMVQKLHELVPLLSDGSGMRACASDYRDALMCAAHNEAHCLPILDYLTSEAGCGILDDVAKNILLNLRTAEEFEWLISHVPESVPAACEMGHHFYAALCALPADACEYVVEQILDLAPRKSIAFMVRNAMKVGSTSGPDGGWTTRFKRLLDEVPRAWKSRRWRLLMKAICKHRYRDVEYFLDVCSQADLARRNRHGEQAADVAAKDKQFPKELLARLRGVGTKNAYS